MTRPTELETRPILRHCTIRTGETTLRAILTEEGCRLWGTEPEWEDAYPDEQTFRTEMCEALHWFASDSTLSIETISIWSDVDGYRTHHRTFEVEAGPEIQEPVPTLLQAMRNWNT